jgi:hypothetical protein
MLAPINIFYYVFTNQVVKIFINIIYKYNPIRLVLNALAKNLAIPGDG